MEQGHDKKHKVMRIMGIGVVIGVVALAVYVMQNMNRVDTDDAYVTGRIHNIAPKIFGTIKTVSVQDNASVSKGELLVEIDPVDYELRVNEARAVCDAEKARLADVEASINAAGAKVAMQEAAFKQALLDKNRADKLYEEAVFSKERHEKVTTAYDVAAAQLKAAEEELAKAKAGKALEESLVRQREASLDIANRNLEYTKIYAPCDGYVTNKSVEVGNQVQPNQPLLAVVALNDIWVVANYKETQLKNVQTGQRVEVKVDAYPGKVFTGRVESIMAGTGAAFSLFPPENALGNYVKIVQRIPVKIVFDKTADERHVLRIGMSCNPSIIVKK